MSDANAVRERVEPHEKTEHPGAKGAALDALDHGIDRKKKIDELLKKDTTHYDSAVGKLIEDKLHGRHGKDKDKHEVAGADGRHYPSTTHWTLPELDAHGKTTGKTLDSDKMTNGELADQLKKTISAYEKADGQDRGKAYTEERNKSKLPSELKAFQDATLEADKLLRRGEPGGLPTKESERMLGVHGELSPEDKATLERIGGPKAVEAFTKAHDAAELFRKDTREFNEKMTKEGAFMEGKTKLCCCVNARNKAISMIYRARTGNPPENASCVSSNLENIF